MSIATSAFSSSAVMKRAPASRRGGDRIGWRFRPSPDAPLLSACSLNATVRDPPEHLTGYARTTPSPSRTSSPQSPEKSFVSELPTAEPERYWGSRTGRIWRLHLNHRRSRLRRRCAWRWYGPISHAAPTGSAATSSPSSSAALASAIEMSQQGVDRFRCGPRPRAWHSRSRCSNRPAPCG